MAIVGRHFSLILRDDPSGPLLSDCLEPPLSDYRTDFFMSYVICRDLVDSPAQWQWGGHAHGWWTGHWTAVYHSSYGRPHTSDQRVEISFPLHRQNMKMLLKANQTQNSCFYHMTSNFASKIHLIEVHHHDKVRLYNI